MAFNLKILFLIKYIYKKVVLNFTLDYKSMLFAFVFLFNGFHKYFEVLTSNKSLGFFIVSRMFTYIHEHTNSINT